MTREVAERFIPQATARRISIDADVAPSGPTVMADRDRLAQILANYLSNAIRYSPDGARVVVRVRQRGATVETEVVDQGPGLTAEQRAHVFDRFYRADPSRSRALGGSGIGLAIARALAEAMGGQVGVESDGPGTGSKFLLLLPGH